MSSRARETEAAGRTQCTPTRGKNNLGELKYHEENKGENGRKDSEVEEVIMNHPSTWGGGGQEKIGKGWDKNKSATKESRIMITCTRQKNPESFLVKKQPTSQTRGGELKPDDVQTGELTTHQGNGREVG